MTIEGLSITKYFRFADNEEPQSLRPEEQSFGLQQRFQGLDEVLGIEKGEIAQLKTSRMFTNREYSFRLPSATATATHSSTK